jgi:hypothetical protein
VMRHASEDPHGWRLRAMLVVLWRGGLRVKEALALSEHDLDPQRGSVIMRDLGQLPRSAPSFAGTPPRRRQAARRASSTPSCARGRARTRGRVAERHPTPARTRQPRHHEHLPAGHRYRGGHLHRSRTSSAHDVGDSRPSALNNPDPERERRHRCSRLGQCTLPSPPRRRGPDRPCHGARCAPCRWAAQRHLSQVGPTFISGERNP